MTHIAKDDAREKRIQNEIIVDAYGPEEQATAWYTVLDDTLHFPFPAKCVAVRAISPLELGEEVEVVGMAPDAECEHDMFVLIGWNRRRFAVPLSGLPEFFRRGETWELSRQLVKKVMDLFSQFAIFPLMLARLSFAPVVIATHAYLQDPA